MPRRKIIRTEEDEEEFLRLRREKNREYQQQYRLRRNSIDAPSCSRAGNDGGTTREGIQNESNASQNGSVRGIISRRKIVRTEEDEEEVLRLRRGKNREYQRQHRLRQNAIDAPSCSRAGNDGGTTLEGIQNESHALQNDSIRGIILRRKIIRTEEDEEEFLRLRREKNREYQRQHRLRQNSIASNSNLESLDRIVEHYSGKMNVLCIHCGARHFPAEKVANKGHSFHDCCSHGSVVLDAVPDFPIELHDLFQANHPKSNDFYNRIRCYNSSFSFASFNANLVNFGARRPGPYCFKIQGQIYYQVNTSLASAPGEPPSYGQLFIVDSNEATQHRLHQNSELDNEIVRLLDRTMREHNVFAQSYQMMSEELANQQRLAFENNKPLPRKIIGSAN